MADDARLVAGRYRLVEPLATGGMGTVWEGWDERLHRPVAIKRLHPQPGLNRADAEIANSRAMREARITARLHHPHAVPVYDVVDSDGSPCLIMQFLPSTSLQWLVNEKGPLQPAEVARIGSEIASALAAAHRAGIVHRDVKPGNVLIAEDGAAKITDFGISHALGDVTLTTTGMLTGTPAYLAPEVARGENSGPASDVFSLGATLYLALEGSPPFGTDPNPMALLHRVSSGEIIAPRRSAELTPILLEMLSSDPLHRPPMIDVAARLAQPPAPVSAEVTSPTARVRPRPAPPPPTTTFSAAPPGRNRERRVRVTAIVAALVVVGLAIVGGLLLGQGGGKPAADQTRTVPGAGATLTRTSAAKTSARTSSKGVSSASSTVSSSTASSSTASSHTSSRASSTGSATTPARLGQAVTGYYAMLPGNTDAGWARLTTQYQNSHVGGRGAYDRFWGGIDRVEVGNVSASAPSSVTATITYHFGDGRVVDERTAFGLVQENGVLKIASSQVLSSKTR